MNKWFQAFHSRTSGVLVFQFVTNAVSILATHIQPDLLLLINLALSSLAIYFHLNPNQIYTPTGSTVTDVTPDTVMVSTPPQS